jgi:hypothetical protein
MEAVLVVVKSIFTQKDKTGCLRCLLDKTWSFVDRNHVMPD